MNFMFSQSYEAKQWAKLRPLALQQWGCWASVSQVQTYAHLLPDAYVAEAAA